VAWLSLFDDPQRNACRQRQNILVLRLLEISFLIFQKLILEVYRKFFGLKLEEAKVELIDDTKYGRLQSFADFSQEQFAFELLVELKHFVHSVALQFH
jgi:hypothetical protein